MNILLIGLAAWAIVGLVVGPILFYTIARINKWRRQSSPSCGAKERGARCVLYMLVVTLLSGPGFWFGLWLIGKFMCPKSKQ